MIDLKTVESIHAILIDRFGGSKGIRDLGSLQAALARPHSTFDQIDLYPNPIDKASCKEITIYRSTLNGRNSIHICS